MAPPRITAGRPEPLGAVCDGSGVNVAVFSTSAEAIFVSLFDPSDRETARLLLPGRTGDVFHGHIAGIGAGARYGLRARGLWNPASGHRFNPAKLLVDPFATRLDRALNLDSSMFDTRIHGAMTDDIDSAPFVSKAIVESPLPFEPPRQPSVEWRDLIIYEMHVRGFTKLREEIPEAIRGTFAGLAHPASIDYLTRLGITAVELLPIAAWIDERHLPRLGLTNYWGYNPIAMLAPDPRLAPGGWAEIRQAVDALHAAGIAVILDIVLNHTGESDELGPTLSQRGLDNVGFYRLRRDNRALYVNDAGCGNVPALERPHVMRLALDALRAAATHAGIDGFRYDLASVLGRLEGGFDPGHPLLAAIGQDPWLKDLIHIAEPWDIGPGGYQLGAFPAGFGEWNDKSRDTFRRFWRGDAGMMGPLATRLAGSADIFAPRHRPLSRSINFVTSHDGFSLADLVAFTNKRNDANGEGNRDGTNDNLSWNCGIEGPTLDAGVAVRRAGDVRALLVTLLAARGTPMLSMGDELGRSQEGNNNAYAQDNELAWIDWAGAESSLIDFVAKLIHLRRSVGALKAEAALTGAPLDDTGCPDVEWLTAEGRPFATRDWEDQGTRTIVAVFYDPGDADAAGGLGPSRAALLLNASDGAVEVSVPGSRENRVWSVAIDSARPNQAPYEVDTECFRLSPRSASILVEQETSKEKRGTRGVADHVLDALSTTAGIASQWFDVHGKLHQVPVDMKRSLLAALGLPVASTADVRAGLALLAQERKLRPVPVATTIRQNGARTIRLGGQLAGDRPVVLTIAVEDGAARRINVAAGEGRRSETMAADGRRVTIREVELPSLPLGRYRIWAEEAPEAPGHLAVVPDAAYLPATLAAGTKSFGIAAQLYALRRQASMDPGDQGLGDFTTLRILAEKAAAAGAVTVGLNPLHALFASDPDRASPYHPSDRRFLDPLAIDAFDLPPALRTEKLAAAIAEAGPQAAQLSARPLVDYRAAAALKGRIFRVLHEAFRDLSQHHPQDPLVAEYTAFVNARGETLRNFAIFAAIEATVGGTLEKFPDSLRTPRSHGVAAFAAIHEEAVSRAIFLQWLADRQFAVAADRARECELKLGFFRDLAVGCAPDGAEAWAEAERLMQGVSIGAPPDSLGPKGQVWALPPYDPRALARDGFESFGRLIAANMTYAGVLRIDHILGLKRLFLVPHGATAADGAYLAYPFDDLVGHLMLESQRAQTAVVGEALGTVPEGLREELSAVQVLSYCVMRFEREGEKFFPPQHYPRLAAACVATHDLPTLAGWWQGADLKEAARLGLLSDVSAATVARDAEKRALMQAVAAPTSRDAALLEAQLTATTSAAVHGFVARSNALLALVQVDDLVMETVAVNMPGTDHERPNWRRKLSAPVETLFTLPAAQAILSEVCANRDVPAATGGEDSP